MSNNGGDWSIQGVAFIDGEELGTMLELWGYVLELLHRAEEHLSVREQSWYANVSLFHLGVSLTVTPLLLFLVCFGWGFCLVFVLFRGSHCSRLFANFLQYFGHDRNCSRFIGSINTELARMLRKMFFNRCCKTYQNKLRSLNPLLRKTKGLPFMPPEPLTCIECTLLVQASLSWKHICTLIRTDTIQLYTCHGYAY